MRGLLVPVEGPLELVEIATKTDGGTLDALQLLVGQDGQRGMIEAVPIPPFPDATSYVNEEGKFVCEPNRRATMLMAGNGFLFDGDYIAGPWVITGFDPDAGLTTSIPDRVADWVLGGLGETL